VSPQTGDKRISGYRINPARDPRQIDLVTEFDDVQRGIYKFNNNELWICINEQSDSVRPTSFEAPKGSFNMLMRLRLADAPAVRPVSAISPAPAPAPVRAATPEPSPEEKARQREERIRKMLLGSWTYTDAKGKLILVVQADGSVTATRYWAKVAKRILDGASTTSHGRWSYDRSWLRVNILSSQDFSMAGQSYYVRLMTVGDDSVVAEDVTGRLMTYRRMQ
jgi:hypothetical protein